jgi:hypothetical protein
MCPRHARSINLHGKQKVASLQLHSRFHRTSSDKFSQTYCYQCCIDGILKVSLPFSVSDARDRGILPCVTAATNHWKLYRNIIYDFTDLITVPWADFPKKLS